MDEQLITKTFCRIYKFYKKIEKDNFSLNFTENLAEGVSLHEKLTTIDHFVKKALKEKKNYFTQSNYELKSLDENFERLQKINGFSQENFINLIDKCKGLINAEREQYLYIEALKQENKNLEYEKNLVIENTKHIIEDLKSKNILLLNQIEKMCKEKEKIEKNKLELAKKTEEIQRRTMEANMLKHEIEKTKNNFTREKNRITIMKNKEIGQLNEQIKLGDRNEREMDKLTKEYFKLKNMLNEVKVMNEKLITEKNKYYAEMIKLENNNASLTEGYKRFEKLYRESRSTINFLINSEPFKEIRHLYSKLETDVMERTENSLN